MEQIIRFIGRRSVLWILLIINFFGTLYGYIWYGQQLKETPVKFLLFVPDSPTASLFFVLVLIALILKKNWPIFEALAIVTLLKYGVWAVVMNFLALNVTGSLSWQGYMLIVSHGAMALQGVLFVPYYRIKAWHIVAVAVWTLHNDMIDYLFGMMPRYGVLDQYTPQIGYFTFWLSIFSIGVSYILCIRKNKFNS